MKPFEIVNGLCMEKPKALIFVDYEYWYYSYLNQYHTTPDVTGWFADMLDRYEVVDTMFFGAFGQPDLIQEIPKLRSVTNSIITTETAGKFHRKDTSDFIMLDFIYQRAYESNENLEYVIFTGDGHFHSAMKFLRFKLNAKVLLCAVKNTVSYQLQTVASDMLLYSHDDTDVMRLCYDWIIDNFEYIEHNPDRRIIPTFNSVTMAVATYNNVDSELIRLALRRLIDTGYISSIEKTVGDDNGIVKILVPNWDLIYSGVLTD